MTSTAENGMLRAECSARGCDRNSRHLGMCGMHYQRMWKRGTTDPAPRSAERSIIVEGDIARVTLTRGRIALIDTAAVDLISGYRWFAAAGHGETFYAQASQKALGASGVLHMHRLITAAPDGLLVDHVNGDGLDNRRANLRLCSAQQNLRNMTVLRGDNRSGFIGVGYRAERRRWRAYVKDSTGSFRHLGHFRTAADAARARDAWIRQNDPSEFWTFNFPLPGERGIRREDVPA